jgi:exopolysaccharide production protein ExoQ
MPPELALFLCFCFIVWLLRRDMKWRKAGSMALLIPGIWIAIIGSRPVGYWVGSGARTNVEGDPINTLTFAVLIGAAVVVLLKRGLNWSTVTRENKAIFLIYLYLAITATWSDVPLLSLKRLLKDFGCVLMALVILTESDPAETVRIIFARVSYILFPLSLVFGKYFPAIGRNYSVSGEPMFTGVAGQKNGLGQIAFVFGLVLLWDLIEMRRQKVGRQRKSQIRICVGMLLLGIWLLVKCDSQTSLLCLILGVLILWGSGRLLRIKRGKSVLIACLAFSICLAALNSTLGLSDIVIRALGRNPTLTGRTDIWRIVSDQRTNPLIGEGFYIFWDSAKGDAVKTAVRSPIQSSHNGYIESYVDSGMVGLILLGLLLLTAGSKVIDSLFKGSRLAQIGLIFWALAMIYNLSESSFFRLDLLWFTFLLTTIKYPRPAMLQTEWSLHQLAQQVPT